MERDVLVCEPCGSNMEWVGEVERWECPKCHGKKHLTKEVPMVIKQVSMQTLTVGDIVRDIHTGIQGRVLVISELHHAGDIDITVEWETAINGHKIFEVHPNEIEFVCRNPEDRKERLDDRYLEEVQDKLLSHSAIRAAWANWVSDHKTSNKILTNNYLTYEWNEYRKKRINATRRDFMRALCRIVPSILIEKRKEGIKA